MAIRECPECGYFLGKLIERGITKGEVIQEFECGECNHQWSVPMG